MSTGTLKQRRFAVIYQGKRTFVNTVSEGNAVSYLYSKMLSEQHAARKFHEGAAASDADPFVENLDLESLETFRKVATAKESLRY